MAKSGFSSSLRAMNKVMKDVDRANRQAQRNRVQAQRAAEREQARLEREAERLNKLSQREADRNAKAAQRESERAAKQAHVDARTAEVAALNAQLQTTYEDLDSLLAATLEVDDYVDLAALRDVPTQYPAFESAFETPHAAPAELTYPPEPVYEHPPVPTGMGKAKKHRQLIAQAQADYTQSVSHWQHHCQQLYDAHVVQLAQWEQAEQQRLSQLAADQSAYNAECEQLNQQAEAVRGETDRLINDLAFDVPEAVETYVGLVLSNSYYPDTYPVGYDYSFDVSTRELSLALHIPSPTAMPATKEYKYVAARDDIKATPATLKDQRTRYLSALHQVALRTLHEVFEADRQGKIWSISMTISTTATDPATGNPRDVTLAAVAAGRDTFTAFDLTTVDPAATLQLLGANVSKKPWDLEPIDASPGVRSQGA